MSDCRDKVLALAAAGGWSAERDWGGMVIVRTPPGKGMTDFRGEKFCTQVVCQNWKEALTVIRSARLEVRR